MYYTIICIQKNVCINQLKSNDKSFSDSTITLKFGALTHKTWDVDINSIVIFLKLVERKLLIGFLDKVVRSFGQILLKMKGYFKTFKVRNGNKDKSNKLMSMTIYDEKLLEKFKSIQTKIENFKNY